MRDDHVMSCDPLSPMASVCPKGYFCQWSTPKQRYQCCGETSLHAYKSTKSKSLLILLSVPAVYIITYVMIQENQ